MHNMAQRLNQIKSVTESKYPILLKEMYTNENGLGDRFYETIILENYFKINIKSINNNCNIVLC